MILPICYLLTTGDPCYGPTTLHWLPFVLPGLQNQRTQPDFEFVLDSVNVQHKTSNGLLISINDKGKFVLCLTKYHAMKTHSGRGGITPRILDLGTRWRWEVSFTSRERAPVTHCIEGCEGFGAGLDAVERRKIPSLCRGSNLWSSSQ
jgi:hypothetical protein